MVEDPTFLSMVSLGERDIGFETKEQSDDRKRGGGKK